MLTIFIDIDSNKIQKTFLYCNCLITNFKKLYPLFQMLKVCFYTFCTCCTFYTIKIRISYINQGTFTQLYSSSTEAALQSVLRKRCSKSIQQIYRSTPIPKFDFNKVAKQLY